MDEATRVYAVGGGVAVLAVLLAGYFGVHHVRWIDGPQRLMREDRLSPLWLAAVIGFYSIYIPGAVYVVTRTAPEPATTAPATKIDLSPRTKALLSTAQPAAVLIAVIVTCSVAFPQWLNRIGLTPRILPRGLLAGAIGIAIVLPVMFMVAQLTQELWDYIKLDHPSAHALLRAMGEDRETWVQVLIMFSAIIMAPVSEELLFRGLLQTAVLYSVSRNATALTRWAAIAITSVVFTLYHPEIWMMPPIFILSMCLGYLYERTGNLWACMLLHAGFNAANVLLFRLQNGH